MALLSRIKSSTLMETLVATVLIVIVFMVASLLLNNMFLNNINKDTSALNEHLTTLEYQWQSGELPSNFIEDWHGWEIQVIKSDGDLADKWVLQAKNAKTQETRIQLLEYGL